MAAVDDVERGRVVVRRYGRGGFGDGWDKRKIKQEYPDSLSRPSTYYTYLPLSLLIP